ncbi:dienelactone hydrolase family protein [Oscillatoria salina]|uniref:dienelactone hydrolase family protein n=1 Tax=Oscillatoria salina TaxID=331517 RepID=UPI0013BC4FC0|nr:dienelactone hydrolase family protein [Oscillatoria salina]MBZ8179117.1 dienelactone hydrolase family protein [Oscillatoria salina IIICB1]NET87010.1 dienelactone hydrolase family protein [Kamptonema sp. SIO1D9]
MKELTRRKFIIVSAIAAGFALCTHPISAQTIVTDAEGLVVGEVKIPVSDGEIPAYRAMPATGADFPVVLVVQEIFGVHEHLQDICRRLAKLGYLAIAPELYARQGDVSQLNDIQEIITQVVSKVPDAQVMSDLDATVAWANNTGKANVEELGITGFCWGGRIVWLYAAHNPNLNAGVAWYGRLIGESTALTPQHPIDLADELKAPVLGLYGGEDSLIPQENIVKMTQALEAADANFQFIVYPDAPHGFYADYRPSYRPEAAADAWQQMLAWFERFGVV